VAWSGTGNLVRPGSLVVVSRMLVIIHCMWCSYPAHLHQLLRLLIMMLMLVWMLPLLPCCSGRTLGFRTAAYAATSCPWGRPGTLTGMPPP
jgi:hypothetical protein